MTTFKTDIIDLLNIRNISYRLLPHTEAVFTVEAAAAQRGVVKEEMVKSILLREKSNPKRYVMACLLGDARLDPKAVRAYLGEDWKRLTFASAKDIRQVTGCIPGDVAPLCLPHEIPVVFDQSIANCHNVNISSGDPMAGLELEAKDLTQLAGAHFALISKK